MAERGTFDRLSEGFAKRFGFGPAVRMRVYEKIATHVANGVGVRDAIQHIADSRLRLAGKGDPIRMAMLDWYQKMGQGLSFGAAIEDWASSTEVMLLSAADEAGQLVGGLEDAIMILDGQSRMKKSIIGGLAYPTVVAIVAIGVCYGFSVFLFPKLARSVDLNTLSGVPAALYAFTQFVQNWLWLVVAVLVVGMGWAIKRLPHSDGRVRVKLDEKLPPGSIYRMTQAAAVLTSIAALIRSGVRIDSALQHLAGGKGRWINNRLEAAIRGMRGGVDIGEAFYRGGHGFPDRELIDDLMVYAQYPGFEDKLGTIAKQFREAAISRVQTITKSVGTALIMILGFTVLFMLGGTMQFVQVLTEQAT